MQIRLNTERTDRAKIKLRLNKKRGSAICRTSLVFRFYSPMGILATNTYIIMK